MRCDWCGKFRKDIDLATYEQVNRCHDDVEQVVVCRWCDPSEFGDPE